MAKKEKNKKVEPNRSARKSSIISVLMIPVLILGLVGMIGMGSSYIALDRCQESSQKITRDGIFMVSLTNEINKELEVIQKQVLMYCVSSDADIKASSLETIQTTFGYMEENLGYVENGIRAMAMKPTQFMVK